MDPSKKDKKDKKAEKAEKAKIAEQTEKPEKPEKAPKKPKAEPVNATSIVSPTSTHPEGDVPSKAPPSQKQQKQQNKQTVASINEMIQSKTELPSSGLKLSFEQMLQKSSPPTQELFEKHPPEQIYYQFITIGHALQVSGSYHKCFTDILLTFQEMISRLDPQKDSRITLNDKLKTSRAILNEFVKTDEVLNNIFSFLSSIINSMPMEMNEENKKKLIDRIAEFTDQKFFNGETQLIEKGCIQINDNDSILVCNVSSVLKKIFARAKEKGKKFTLYILASQEPQESESMAIELEKLKIPIVFTHINNIQFVISMIDKVFINGICMFSNGYLQAAAGSAIVSMVAHRHRKPVYALLRTIRFSENAYMDSLKVNTTKSMKGFSNGFQLAFDLVPQKYIGMVVTELGRMPPYMVPVVLRQMGDGRT